MAKLSGTSCRLTKAGSPVDDDLEYLPLSGLSQADYCLRRAALLLNERVWHENEETAMGRAEHERVHTQLVERRGDHIRLYENSVFSDQLRISGKCDCIEAVRSQQGCVIPAADFPVQLQPVEYKHGILRDESEYKIQLCAQAMCLEEMYQTSISCGAVFYISAHRRLEVCFDEELRQQVRDTVQKLWTIRQNLLIPPAEYGPKCRRCSMADYCMPKVKTSARAYCKQLMTEATKDEDD